MKAALKARKYRPIFIIDIAVPRNVNPHLNSLRSIAYDVDDLNSVADENLAARRREAEEAEALVEREALRFFGERAVPAVTPTIVALRRRAAAIEEAGLARAWPRLGALDDKQRKAVEVLANSVINKLLHDVTTGLKRSADTPEGPALLAAVQRLFALEDEEE